MFLQRYYIILLFAPSNPAVDWTPYLGMHAGGEAHGVLVMNSNGMDVVLLPTTMQFRTTGGVLDMYFLAGPTPMDVLNQATSIFGRPLLPPYWSLGLMHSK